MEVLTPTVLAGGGGGNASVAGSDTQIQYNASGVLGASADLTWDNTAKQLGVGGSITLSLAGAASTPPLSLTDSWFSGGTATTTKPQLLIEPVGTTSTAWSTSGTGLGVNAASGFAGNLLDLQVNGSSKFVFAGEGLFGIGTAAPGALFHAVNTSAGAATLGAVIQNASTSANTEIRLAFSPNNAAVSDDRYAYIGAINVLGSTDNSLTFGTGAGAPATERMRIKSSGIVNVANTPVYADNAAAKTGGLVDGDIYRKSDGTLMIVYT